MLFPRFSKTVAPHTFAVRRAIQVAVTLLVLFLWIEHWDKHPWVPCDSHPMDSACFGTNRLSTNPIYCALGVEGLL